MQKVRWCSASYPRCLCSLDGSWCASLSLSLSFSLSLSLAAHTRLRESTGNKRFQDVPNGECRGIESTISQEHTQSFKKVIAAM
jgi:hypothetical protein